MNWLYGLTPEVFKRLITLYALADWIFTLIFSFSIKLSKTWQTIPTASSASSRKNHSSPTPLRNSWAKGGKNLGKNRGTPRISAINPTTATTTMSSKSTSQSLLQRGFFTKILKNNCPGINKFTKKITLQRATSDTRMKIQSGGSTDLRNHRAEKP